MNIQIQKHRKHYYIIDSDRISMPHFTFSEVQRIIWPLQIVDLQKKYNIYVESIDTEEFDEHLIFYNEKSAQRFIDEILVPLVMVKKLKGNSKNT